MARSKPFRENYRHPGRKPMDPEQRGVGVSLYIPRAVLEWAAREAELAGLSLSGFASRVFRAEKRRSERLENRDGR